MQHKFHPLETRKILHLIIAILAMVILTSLFATSYATTKSRSFFEDDVKKGRFEKIAKKKKAPVVDDFSQDDTEADHTKTVTPPDLPNEENQPGDQKKSNDDNPFSDKLLDSNVIPLPSVVETDDSPKTKAKDVPEGQAEPPREQVNERPALQFDKNWPGWLLDYRIALQKGREDQKSVLVYFYDTDADSPYKDFETKSLTDEEVKRLLENYICVRIPITAKLSPPASDAQLPEAEEKNKPLLEETPKESTEELTVLAEKITPTQGGATISQTVVQNSKQSADARHTAMRPTSEKIDAAKLIVPGRDMGSVTQLKVEDFDLTFPKIEEEMMLIRHPAFYEMLNTPGIAIIDFEHKDAEYYGDVVSVLPFLNKKPYTVEQTRAILSLPPGTVTQRSVIFAVRIHPDKPKSTTGELNARLVKEARSHSQYQADIRNQGHHNWDRRFRQINMELPTELWAGEVCAESWPGQHLLESAIECVRCWRFSEGHWSAVSAEHPYYGYDMKLGNNGIWYATGVFGKWRHPALAKAGTVSKK